jgi:hypothetical protein
MVNDTLQRTVARERDRPPSQRLDPLLVVRQKAASILRIRLEQSQPLCETP